MRDRRGQAAHGDRLGRLHRDRGGARRHRVRTQGVVSRACLTKLRQGGAGVGAKATGRRAVCRSGKQGDEMTWLYITDPATKRSVTAWQSRVSNGFCGWLMGRLPW